MYFFDLDGTLLDSNGIWLDIDRDFLARHGISPVPEDYTEYVTHHSFPDAAAYTRRRFGLDIPEEDICQAWLDMALEAYSHQLPLKPGGGGLYPPCPRPGGALRPAVLLYAGAVPGRPGPTRPDGLLFPHPDRGGIRAGKTGPRPLPPCSGDMRGPGQGLCAF